MLLQFFESWMGNHRYFNTTPHDFVFCATKTNDNTSEIKGKSKMTWVGVVREDMSAYDLMKDLALHRV